MIYQFAFQVILILIIVSAVISFIGNYVGRFFGKKRLSLFGLRPRYTATAFTLMSGMLIALLTFALVVYISFDARTAFFGLEELRSQIKQAKSDLNSAKKDLKIESEKLKKSINEIEESRKELGLTKNEIEELQETKVSLKNEIEVALSRRVIYTSGDVIYRALARGGAGKDKAELELNNAVKQVTDKLKTYNAKEVEYDLNDYNSTISYLANMEGEIILRIIVNRNFSMGGTPAIRFDVLSNQLLYSKGDEIKHALISAKLSSTDIEQQLKDLLAEAEHAARVKGMLIGDSGTFPYEKMYEAVRRIKGYGSLTKVAILAASNIYTIGPLSVEFKVEP